MGRSFPWPWASNGNAASIRETARIKTFAGMLGAIIPPSAKGRDILRKVCAVHVKNISWSRAVAGGCGGAVGGGGGEAFGSAAMVAPYTLQLTHGNGLRFLRDVVEENKLQVEIG